MSWRKCQWGTKWVMKPGFVLVFLAASDSTSLGSHCVTPPVPQQQYLQSVPAELWQSSHCRSTHTSCTVRLKCNPSKAKVMLLGEQRWSESQGSLFYAHVLPSVQCLSDCLASLDKKMPGDTPFAVLSNILSKSLMTGLRKFVPSGEIFLTKFRYWLYRCLF